MCHPRVRTSQSPPPSRSRPDAGRLAVLDGWRAISILLVLASHLLPLGPKSWDLNSTAGPMGMSLFFTLSGFLITTTLHQHPSVPAFFVRRLCRIVPLAVLASTLLILMQANSLQGELWPYFSSHFLFYTNYDDSHVTPLTTLFWSLGVEVHFYVAVAVLAAFLGNRGLLLLPVAALAITGLRIADGQTISIRTHYRVDEILAGTALALASLGKLNGVGKGIDRSLRLIPFWVWAAAFAVSCHPASGPIQYLRPYLGSATVGSTLLSERYRFAFLCSRPMRYIAEISYALYVAHSAVTFGWLGSGNTLVKYLKRPIGFALTFGLAHASTFYYERHFIGWGKRLTRWLERPKEGPWPEASPPEAQTAAS